MSEKINRKRKGFTLPEIIAALWLCTLLVLSVLLCFSHMVMVPEKNRPAAALLAVSHMEAVRGSSELLKEIVNAREGRFPESPWGGSRAWAKELSSRSPGF